MPQPDAVWPTEKLQTPTKPEAGLDQAGQAAGKKAAARDSRAHIGPVVLCLFMLCILGNCLVYVYHQSRDFWTEMHVTSFKSALIHDYRDDSTSVIPPVAAAAEAAPLPRLQESWHKLAPGSDVDELRMALRLAFHAGHPKTVETWVNPLTGHRGAVTPVSQTQDVAGCRRFHIQRYGATPMADTVDFCADGSIRQGLK